MAVKVLIVDDSGFFRRRLTDLINQHPNLEVIGTASNGQEGIDKAAELRPDVITMDYEMPVMDGITAVKRIMAATPTPILMFSSLTHEGARVTLDSLEAGAVDYLPKHFEDIAQNSDDLKRRLHNRLLEVAKSHPGGAARTSSLFPSGSSLASKTMPSAASRASTPSRMSGTTVTASATSRISTSKAPSINHPVKLVAIGTSTGGPVALQTLLTKIPANFPVPIVLIQHMPSSFTPAFAERLNRACQISVKEAVDGDVLRPGCALLAPGGQQMMISGRGQVKVLPGDERLHYKPCVDVTFGSAANVFGKEVLAIILTGMGADGTEGARMLKGQGATVWSQDEETSVIYGMPMAVAKANLTDAVMPLEAFAANLVALVK
jgi:two-component system, chemotaxis family, protein-glutamate methylesterase/glutaminase